VEDELADQEEIEADSPSIFPYRVESRIV
jgi:hypothetical protein